MEYKGILFFLFVMYYSLLALTRTIQHMSYKGLQGNKGK